MMKANELRIGNYLYDSGLKVVKIECLMSDRYAIWDDRDSNLEFSYQSDDINMYHPEPNELCPIPLTDEILRDWCGFSVNEDGFSCAQFAKSDKGYSLRSFDISSRDGMFFLWVPADDQWYSSELTEIKYIHQLQNLYFALTGEELTINIPKQ